MESRGPSNKSLQQTNGALARMVAPFAAEQRRSADQTRLRTMACKTPAGCTAAAVALALLLPACTNPTPVAVAGCGITVTMPASPSREQFDTQITGGSVGNEKYEAVVAGVAYGFICTSTPGLLDGDTPENILPHVKDAFVVGGASLVGERAVSLGRFSGTELTVARPSEFVRVRAYVFPDALATVTVVGPERALASPAAEEYFRSVRLNAR